MRPRLKSADVPPVGGGPDARVTLERPPSSSPGWRVTSNGVWLNDLSGEVLGPGAPLPLSPPVGPQVYVANFDRGGQQWKSIFPFHEARERAVPWQRAGFIQSKGPWWPDSNHDVRADGQLGVNLVAYLDSRNLLPDVHVHDREIDFRNARLEFRIRGENLSLRDAQLVFWVQSRPHDARHFVNLALTGEPLTGAATSGRWTSVALDLDPDGEWTCLGPAPSRLQIYGCASPTEVLSDANRDFGFLLYPVPIDKAGAGAPRGSISFDDIRLTYRLNERKRAGGS